VKRPAPKAGRTSPRPKAKAAKVAPPPVDTRPEHERIIADAAVMRAHRMGRGGC